MSLEEALNKNTAAVEKNTAAVEAHTAALLKLAGGAAAAKPAAAGKPAGAAAGTAKPAGAAAKPKAPTIDDIRTKFGGYLSTKDADLKAARMEQVQAINAHFGVAKATDLDPSLYAEALGYLAEYEAGREPEFAQADEGGEGGDESLV